jgi:hypothetical protein
MPTPVISKVNCANGLDVTLIAPNKGAKYSPNLFKWLTINGSHSSWSSKVYRDVNGLLWIGIYDGAGELMGSMLNGVLCNGVKEGSAAHQRVKATEVTNFWMDYVKSGRCAIDSAHETSYINDDSRWTHHGENRFGTTTNSKGYRVLNHVRIIQGDGINLDSLRTCLSDLHHNGFSADNIAFGMGGGLLQQVNSDTLQFAMKCSAMQVGDEWRDVYKQPIGDSGKASKRGHFALVEDNDKLVTVRRGPDEVVQGDRLKTVYKNGEILNNTTFDDIRARVARGIPALTTPFGL